MEGTERIETEESSSFIVLLKEEILQHFEKSYVQKGLPARRGKEQIG